MLLLLFFFALNTATAYHVLGTDKVGQDVFYQTLKSIRTGVFASASVVTIAALCMGLIVFRQIMRPLVHLSDASRRIADGE